MKRDEQRDQITDALIAKIQASLQAVAEPHSLHPIRGQTSSPSSALHSVEMMKNYIKTSITNTDYAYVKSMEVLEDKKRDLQDDTAAKLGAHQEHMRCLDDIEKVIHPGVIAGPKELAEIKKIIEKSKEATDDHVRKIIKAADEGRSVCDAEKLKARDSFSHHASKHGQFASQHFKSLVQATRVEALHMTEDLEEFLDQDAWAERLQRILLELKRG